MIRNIYTISRRFRGYRSIDTPAVFPHVRISSVMFYSGTSYKQITHVSATFTTNVNSSDQLIVLHLTTIGLQNISLLFRYSK